MTSNLPFQATEQQLADQARNIPKRGFLSCVELDALKAIIEAEIAEIVSTQNPEDEDSPGETTPPGGGPHDISIGNEDEPVERAAGCPSVPVRNNDLSIPTRNNDPESSVNPALQSRLLELFLDVKNHPKNE